MNLEPFTTEFVVRSSQKSVVVQKFCSREIEQHKQHEVNNSSLLLSSLIDSFEHKTLTAAILKIFLKYFQRAHLPPRRSISEK